MGIILAAALTTTIKTDHFSVELPGKWRAHPTEKSDFVELGSYEQQDGPGFLTTSAMTFRTDTAKDPETRRRALLEIVALRRKALLDASSGDVSLGPDEVAEDRLGHRSMSLSYVDRRNGMVGRFSALLAGNKVLTFMYYEQASPAAQAAVENRARLVLNRCRITP